MHFPPNIHYWVHKLNKLIIKTISSSFRDAFLFLFFFLLHWERIKATKITSNICHEIPRRKPIQRYPSRQPHEAREKQNRPGVQCKIQNTYSKDMQVWVCVYTYIYIYICMQREREREREREMIQCVKITSLTNIMLIEPAWWVWVLGCINI